MWELMQKILKDKLTPNQLLLLYCLKNKVSTQQINNWLELNGLQDNNLVEGEEGSFSITTQGKMILRKYDNYFVKAKKKTNIQLMGKDLYYWSSILLNLARKGLENRDILNKKGNNETVFLNHLQKVIDNKITNADHMISKFSKNENLDELYDK